MDYCGPRGLPRSEFLRWAKDDRDAALVWLQRSRQRCHGCGTHPDEWDEKLGGHPRAYVATIHSCPGCAATENRQRRLDQERKGNELEFAGKRVGLRSQDTREATR